MPRLPAEIIIDKRDGNALSSTDISDFISGVTSGSVSDAQIAAFAMATLLNGMDRDERVALTVAMKESGEVLDWSRHDFGGPTIDKHSTGGVGDKVSLVLGPVLAACGGFVPMISGRGLGHTGGTLDKFDAIPGYSTSPDLDLFGKVVKQAGCAIVGQTADMAPADKRIYAVRDVTGTVESLDLITASILSKKLAAGLDALVLDVKVGTGAFMKTMDAAQSLAQTLVDVANGAGLKTTALITDMNQVLGRAAGNGVEVAEAVEILTGHADKYPRLTAITLDLCAEVLATSGLYASVAEARAKALSVLSDGSAAECFGKMVAGLGGPTDFMEKYQDYLPTAAAITPIYPTEAGIVQAIDTRELGLCVVGMGGGRMVAEDEIDYSIGLTDVAFIGEHVDTERPLLHVHAPEHLAEGIAARVRESFVIGDEVPDNSSLVYDRITESKG
ncbi:MAG: thymidine phosphorylase [Alphaproteobacteria bacterium]